MANNIKVGDRVRVLSGSASAAAGEVFTVTEIHHTESPYNKHGHEGYPDFYVMGDKGNRGVWAQFLEVIEPEPELPADPETQNIKRAFKRFALNGMITEDEALSIFNKWYGAELEEAREEGRQEARAEVAAVPAHFIVFTGAHERYEDSSVAVDRTEALAKAGIETSIVRVDAISPVYTTRTAHVVVGQPGVIA